ncbi:MAG: MBL fold metallo-hydrolase [Chthoniobacterales bacterium]
MAFLTFLGTGSGFPAAGRSATSILLRETATGSGVLFDAGEPCALKLREIGVAFDSISRICLSHAHADHVGGLPLFLQGAMIENRTKALDIHAPSALLEGLKNWLSVLNLAPDSLPFVINFHPMREKETCVLKEFSGPPELEFFPTTHLRKHDREAFGCLVRRDDKQMLVSGDLGGIEDLKFIDGDTFGLLICELTHISLEDLAEGLKNTQINNLGLVHVQKELLSNVVEARAFLNESLPKCEEVLFLRDGDFLEF